MQRMTRAPWAYLTAVLLSLCLGCGSSPGEGGDEGEVHLVSTLSQAVSSSDVTSVVVTVTAADMQALTASLVKTNGQWSGTLGKLPAGTNRTFTAEAFNSTGARLYAGTATPVTILARQTTAVSITLQEVNPAAPFQDAAPVITSLSAAPGTVEPGGVVSLSATASDANPGDTLTYAWTAPSGTFAQAASLSTTWTAGASPATVPLTLTVTDSKGIQTRVAFNLNVTTGKGDATLNTSLNTWPQVSGISATETVLALNESTTVSATASDNDGDTLAYRWTASCAGSWAGATSASATFTPTALPSSSTCNNCTLTVTVTDHRNSQAIGGQTTGTLSLCVGPKTTATFPPDITETFQSAMSSSAGGTVTFRLKAVDPQDSALSFSWAANAGTPGTASTSAGASAVVWTAPACVPASTTPTITATVSNALGASVSHAFTVTGLPVCAAPGPSVAGGFRHSAMIKPDGTVWTWGGSAFGQLGNGSTTAGALPAQVAGLAGFTAVATGEAHTVALRQDGTVWVWGYNFYGQLGDGTTLNRTTPVQVPGLNGVTAIFATYSRTFAVRQDGTVWAWGDNRFGQLGDGTTLNRTTPVQVPGLNNVTSIAGGELHTVVLRQDGTVWTSGRNSDGQLGYAPNCFDCSTLRQVPTLNGMTAVAAGERHSVALRQDGTVWAWGHNDYGQLGDGTITSRSSPVQAANLGNVTAIVSGWRHTGALRNDGTVWSWGYNDFGELGDGTIIKRYTPVQVAGLDGVTAIFAGFYHRMALRQNGTLWAWGNNGNYQLGDRNGTRHLPAPVPAF